MRNIFVLPVFNYKLKILPLLGLFLLISYNCKKKESINTSKEINSDSIQLQSDLVQLKVDTVYSDGLNTYFKINIQNNSLNNYYFPVDFDYSLPFFDRLKKISADFNYSYFYTQYFDKNHQKIFGVWINSSMVDDYRKKFDSLIIKDSLYQLKYGQHPNPDSREKIFWGVKYHGIKKNGFFVDQNKNTELVVRSHLGFDIRAFATEEISFTSSDLDKIKYTQLILHIDSSQIKRDLLLPKDIDSLHQNNIKIFHGTIYSNKVPLKFE